MLRVVTHSKEALSPRIRKDELTIEVIDLAKPSMRSDTKACHRMDQRSTNEEVDQWTKLAIGFKDDGMINVHKLIKWGTTWWCPMTMNQQLHDEAGLQGRANDS
jgi:hypothetical protein